MEPHVFEVGEHWKNNLGDELEIVLIDGEKLWYQYLDQARLCVRRVKFTTGWVKL